MSIIVKKLAINIVQFMVFEKKIMSYEYFPTIQTQHNTCWGSNKHTPKDKKRENKNKWRHRRIN